MFHLKAKLNVKKNKDDNIHESEALKYDGRTTITLIECQNFINNRISICNSK